MPRILVTRRFVPQYTPRCAYTDNTPRSLQSTGKGRAPLAATSERRRRRVRGARHAAAGRAARGGGAKEGVARPQPGHLDARCSARAWGAGRTHPPLYPPQRTITITRASVARENEPQRDCERGTGRKLRKKQPRAVLRHNAPPRSPPPLSNTNTVTCWPTQGEGTRGRTQQGARARRSQRTREAAATGWQRRGAARLASCAAARLLLQTRGVVPTRQDGAKRLTILLETPCCNVSGLSWWRSW